MSLKADKINKHLAQILLTNVYGDLLSNEDLKDEEHGSRLLEVDNDKLKIHNVGHLTSPFSII